MVNAFNGGWQMEKQQQMNDDNIHRNIMNDSERFENQPFNHVGPNFSTPSQPRDDGNPRLTQSQYQESHPALFGQSQFKDGFGPVYATPTFPWIPIPNSGSGNNPGHQNPSQGTRKSSGQKGTEQSMGWTSFSQGCGCPRVIPTFYMVPCMMPSSFGQQYYQ